MNRTTDLHRCTVCDRIAEWHYIVGEGGRPSYGLQAGIKCWSPGEGTSGNEPHALSPDFTKTVRLADVTP